MTKPTFADMKRRIIAEGANLDDMLANGGPPKDEPQPIEAATSGLGEGAPVEESGETAPEQAAEGAAGEAEEGESMPAEEATAETSPDLTDKLIEYGPPDTWSTQTIQMLEQPERKALKEAWSAMTPEQQDSIRMKAKARARGEKTSKPGDVAVSFGRH